MRVRSNKIFFFKLHVNQFESIHSANKYKQILYSEFILIFAYKRGACFTQKWFLVVLVHIPNETFVFVMKLLYLLKTIVIFFLNQDYNDEI